MVTDLAIGLDGSFDSGNLNPGQSFPFTFATPALSSTSVSTTLA